MSTEVSRLLDEAMQLSSDSQIELAEAILEKSLPSGNFMEDQMKKVKKRMKDVREGKSRLIPEEEAHESVRSSLKARR
ncbi:MAG: addiction module protein [Verrucomicrobiota bacterium]